MIIDYFYVRDLLTDQEKELYQKLVFGDYVFSIEEYAKECGIDVDSIRDMINNIKRTLKELKSYKNGESYRMFQAEMRKKQSRIFNLDLDGPNDVDVKVECSRISLK